MFTEELQKVRTAETSADALRKSARQEAKRLTTEAESEAAALLAKAEKEARSRFDAHIAEGEAAAEAQYAQILQETEKKCEVLRGEAQERMPAVVQTLVERIVKSSGDH